MNVEPPYVVEGLARLFFVVGELRRLPDPDRPCCAAPLPGPGVYEVRRRIGPNQTAFHWHRTHDGWTSFRRPNDVESHHCRVLSWELKEDE